MSAHTAGIVGPWTWVVETERQHTVVVAISLTRQVRVTVDGEIVLEEKSRGKQSEHMFAFAGKHRARLLISSGIETLKLALAVDGHDLQTPQGLGSWAILPGLAAAAGAMLFGLVASEANVSAPPVLVYTLGGAAGGLLGAVAYGAIKAVRPPRPPRGPTRAGGPTGAI